MNKRAETTLKLEQVLHQALGGLPPRRAPGTLESRVANELARRASQPWWLASFANWPVGARVSFVLVCAALVAVTILGGVAAYLGDRSFGEVSAVLLSWAHPFLTVVSSAGGLVALLVRAVPPGVAVRHRGIRDSPLRGAIRAGCGSLPDALSAALFGR